MVKDDVEVPKHSHIYDWEYNHTLYDNEGLEGVRCTFMYESLGPARLQCPDFVDMNDVLEIVNQCMEYYRATFGEKS